MSPFLLIGICTLRFIIANILHVIPHHLNSFLNKQFCAFLPSGKTWSPSANPLPRSNTFLPNKVLFVSKPTGSRRGTGVATPGRATPARRPLAVRKFLHRSPPAVPMVTKWHRASHWLCPAGSWPGPGFLATFLGKAHKFLFILMIIYYC